MHHRIRRQISLYFDISQAILWILYGKTPFLVPPPAPGGPTKKILQMGKSRPWDESNKKDLKSLAGLEAEISMERTADAQTEMRAYKRYHYRGLR